MEKFCSKTIIIGRNSMRRNGNTNSDNQRRQGTVTVLLVNGRRSRKNRRSKTDWRTPRSPVARKSSRQKNPERSRPNEVADQKRDRPHIEQSASKAARTERVAHRAVRAERVAHRAVRSEQSHAQIGVTSGTESRADQNKVA